MTYLKILLGFTLLGLGAEFLVRGAAKIARGIGVSSLVVGLTIVAFGTSLPELMVSIKAAIIGNSDICIANVVGSNTFNVLFILGICALVKPLAVSHQLIKIDVPVMIFSSILLFLLASDGKINFLEGFIMAFILVNYTVIIIKKSKSEEESPIKIETKYWVKNLSLILGGFVLLALGADYLVNGAIELARLLGVDDAVIGLTIVAAGTSLPELATSFVATLKGERDIAIGNIIGSNIFNILFILGASSMFSAKGLIVSPDILHYDIPVTIGVALLCYPVFVWGKIISRSEGFLFLASYVAYTIFLILKATNSPILSQYKWGVMFMFLPILIIGTLIINYKRDSEKV